MLSRLSWKVIALAAPGSLLLVLLAGLWLQIPDSHVWQFCLSMLVGLALILGFVWLQTTLVRHIRLGTGATPQALAIMAVWMVVGWGLAQSIETLSVHVVERAGFWNSQLSAHQRTLFTEARLETWQNGAIDTLLWFLLPGLLLPLVIETVSGGGLRTVGRVYARWQMWLTVGIATTAGCWLTGKLSTWHPAESVRGELISAFARLSLLYVLLLAIGLIALAIVSELLARADARPDLSPREDIPR